MNKLLSTIAVLGLVASMSWCQPVDPPGPGPGEGAGLTQEQKQKRAGLNAMMGNMPEDTKQQIRAALNKAEEARKQIQEMKKQGSSNEDVEKVMEQKRTQAREQLQQAIDALADVPEDEKEKLQKVRERIQERLQERKAEFEANKAQEQKGSGEKPENPGKGE